jgi:hypothetical protein
MKKYQLEDLNIKDIEIVRQIAGELVADEMIRVGMAFSFTNLIEQTKTGYLSALVEQNWLIISLLSRINNNIEILQPDDKRITNREEKISVRDMLEEEEKQLEKNIEREECPHCHKLSNKKYNVCEYCNSLKK